jgi:uncharacterized protein YkwD
MIKPLTNLLLCLSLIGLINGRRAKPLQHSYRLSMVAQCRLYQVQKYFSHNNWSYCFILNGVYGNRGEVLARWWGNDPQIVNAWFNSPSHRDVLTSSFRYAGSAQANSYSVVVLSL